MVFPGRFSTGCLRCRQRKVKCDEAKPSCRRCCIYGKPCPGYTDQFQFRHRGSQSSPWSAVLVPEPAPAGGKQGQTGVAGPDHRRGSQSPREDQQQQQQQEEQRQRQAGQIVRWDQPVDIVRAPDPSYDDVSLFYFVRRFVSPNPEDGFPGHLSFLPSMYDSRSQGLLENATLCVAQMAAYNKFGGEKFRVQSYRHYGRAIRMLQEIIRSEDQATDDKVITSILLLCTLKDISGEAAGDPGEHAPGLFYLIEKRGPEQIVTSRGAELLFLALIRLQVYSFLHDDDTYVDPGAIATAWGVFDPLLRALAMMSRTVSLRNRLLSPDHALLDPQEQAALLQSCFETLDDFHNWDAEAAAYWRNTFEGRTTPTALGEVAAGTTHYDPETACIIILVRSERLILLMSMIAYHHYQQHQYEQQQQHQHQQQQQQPGDSSIHNSSSTIPDPCLTACVPILEQHVHLAIEDMLASVPYALGDVGPGGAPGTLAHDGAAAIVIVQSIRLVASCALASPEQLRRATAVLARLDAGIGIRAAAGPGLRVDEQEGEEGVDDGVVKSSRWMREQKFLRERLAARGGLGAMGTPPASAPLLPLALPDAAPAVGWGPELTSPPALGLAGEEWFLPPYVG